MSTCTDAPQDVLEDTLSPARCILRYGGEVRVCDAENFIRIAQGANEYRLDPARVQLVGSHQSIEAEAWLCRGHDYALMAIENRGLMGPLDQEIERHVDGFDSGEVHDAMSQSVLRDEAADGAIAKGDVLR